MSLRSAETQTEMRVPLIDLSAQHRSLREQLLVAIERVVDSQQFVLGPEVQALEEGMPATVIPGTLSAVHQVQMPCFWH